MFDGVDTQVLYSDMEISSLPSSIFARLEKRVLTLAGRVIYDTQDRQANIS